MKGLLSCTLLSSLINIPHSPTSQAKLPHLYLLVHEPASEQHGIVLPFISPAGFHLAPKSVGRRSTAEHNAAGAHMFTRPQASSSYFIAIGMETKQSSEAGGWHPCFFFSFFMPFRQRALRRCSVAADNAGLFCLWKSQWGWGWGWAAPLRNTCPP